MGGVRRLLDPHAGDWLRARLLPWQGTGIRAGSVVPVGFEEVVRVLHPPGDGRSWGRVAADAGRVIHPLVQWCCIADHFDGRGRHSEVDPEEGSDPAPTLEAILDHCPADGDVSYAVWDGFGFWDEKMPDPATLIMLGHGRDYLLFEGPKAPVTRWPGMNAAWPQSANLIWPTDRSWCVATDIDWDGTLIAGPAAVCSAILEDERLEAFSVDYEDDLSWFGDVVNPRPAWLTPLAAPRTEGE